MKIVISVAVGIAALFVLWVVMSLLGGLVDFLWPVQYGISDLPRKVYGFLRWAVPIVGALVVTGLAYAIAKNFGS